MSTVDFYAVLDQVVELVRSRGRVSYQALKLKFHLDEKHFQALKEELLYAHGELIRDVGFRLCVGRRTNCLSHYAAVLSGG